MQRVLFPTVTAEFCNFTNFTNFFTLQTARCARGTALHSSKGLAVSPLASPQELFPKESENLSDSASLLAPLPRQSRRQALPATPAIPEGIAECSDFPPHHYHIDDDRAVVWRTKTLCHTNVNKTRARERSPRALAPPLTRARYFWN